MRSRRTAHDEMAAIARRRLELLSVELAGLRESADGEPDSEASAKVPRGDDAAAEGPSGVTTDPVLTGTTSAAPVPPAKLSRASASSVMSASRPVRGAQVVTVVETAPEEDGEVSPTELDAWVRPARGRHALRPVGAGDRVGGWVHDRLPPTLQGRVALTASHLSLVALLVAAAFAVSAWWVVRADASGTVVPAATWSEGTDSPPVEQLVTPAGDAGPDSGHDAATVADAESAVVVVDVSGKVRRPGIVSLPLGSRVHDALAAAGGARRGVDLTGLNLARVLVDGEQILVGVAPAEGVAAPAASAPGAVAMAGPMVNVNTADQAELEELPGIGPVTAASILQWRADNGPFTSVDELLEVSGIGDATLAKIAPFVTL
ncbi:MAG TPA: ComEA family DNA-binding protein [Nocardioidaceae bacterium]|nr:ComEA family DNA-binding protein [Nocardioidaceae bacterium]